MPPSSTQPAAVGVPFPAAPEIIFTDWREELHRRGLSPAMKSRGSTMVKGSEALIDYFPGFAFDWAEHSTQAFRPAWRESSADHREEM